MHDGGFAGATPAHQGVEPGAEVEPFLAPAPHVPGGLDFHRLDVVRRKHVGIERVVLVAAADGEAAAVEEGESESV